jgi:Ig-like domain from next to BRCA1 gene
MKNYKNRILNAVILGLVGFCFSSACIPEITKTPSQDPGPVLTSVSQTVAVKITDLAVITSKNQEGSLVPGKNVEQTATKVANLQSTPVSKPDPDQALLVSQSPERDAQVQPGSQITFVWKIKNTGSSYWTQNYKVVFFSGDRIGTGLPLQYRLADVVKPGDTTQITVKVITGTTPGEFRTIWVLTNEQGRYFFPLNGSVKVVKNSTP